MRRLLPGLFVALLLGPVVRAQEEPASPAPSAARVLQGEELRRRLGLVPGYANVRGIEQIKVAILDHGFDGLDGKRPYLPPGYQLVEHYDSEFIRRFQLGDPEFRKPFEPGNTHGRLMAQIVWAMAGSPPRGPQFYLLNANGPTLFRRAVRHAIEARVDIILFSGNFEGAGNYDGRGPINAVVDDALAAGILWVNAAGNHGGAIYNGPVRPGPDGWLRFPTGDALRFVNRLDENSVTVTLTWNDYRATEDAGTDKDLDLVIEGSLGQVVGRSELRQVSGNAPAEPGTSRNPRERAVVTDLRASEFPYRIRVRDRSHNFSANDRLRVLVTAARDFGYRDPAKGTIQKAVQFLDASESGEVFPPADHRGVLTVGDASRSSSIGPTADGRTKPDVLLESSAVRFSNGDETDGSSNAAALFAGALVVLKAAQPGLRAEHVLALARQDDRPYEATRSAPAGNTIPGGVPLTPNQERALRYAEESRRRQQAAGAPADGVRLSSPGRPDLEQAFRVQVGSSSYTVTRPRDPRDSRNPREATGPVVRRPPPPRAPWRAPPPSLLAAVLRARP